MRVVTLLVLTILQLTFNNAVADEKRAKVNYMLNCQGCHTPDGSGHEGRNIPTLTNFMGKFLKVDGGREFLIQVPGASQSSLNDEELAEVTNWMLRSFDPESIDETFTPYNTEEVHQLRKTKVVHFTQTRKNLVAKIQLLH